MAILLSSASRESLAAAGQRLDDVVDRSSGDELTQLGEDLFAVLRLLVGQTTLRRHLADPSVPGDARSALADRLLNGKISLAAQGVVSDLVSARWSHAGDLVEALEQLARRAVLAVAEKDQSLDEVEDQLFRFGRILDREPQLSSLLADEGAPPDKRAGLLREILGDRVTPVTATLLEQTVRTPRDRHLDRAAEELSELAASRRDRYVAHVRTAVRLTPDQEHRLAESMRRIYQRPISLQVELDPSLLGGLVVRVGGDLIDGSVSTKLATARRTLPG
jgi:F-type H+-transporting ATPase subunit delta